MKNYVFIIGCCLLFGCENDIRFDGKEPVPKMVVNAIINAQSDTNLIKIFESVFDKTVSKPALAGISHQPFGRHLFRAGKNLYQYAGRVRNIRYL
jgi:PBP1b-binding outer membrane lipoprotein LpoB